MEVLNTTKITICWEMFEAGVPKRHIARQLGLHWETVGNWIKRLDIYTNAKKGPRIKRQVDPILKRWVWETREREADCCGQKIRYFLDKEHKVKLSVPKIYEILAEKYQINSKWKKNTVRGPRPKANKPREVIQMDTIDFGEVFAFTGIDIFSKEADVVIFPSLTSHDGLVFLETSMARRFDNYSDLIQTDGGPEFKEEFKKNVYRFTNRHRIARLYKKNEQSYIESFNRSLRKECLGWIKYSREQLQKTTTLVEDFLDRYHYHRPHMGLEMRPPLTRG